MYKFLSQSLDLLKSILNREIILIHRYILKSDYASLPESTRVEDSDGPIEMELSGNLYILFESNTNNMSVCISNERMKNYGESYVNIEASVISDFWKDKINKKIVEISILKSKYSKQDFMDECGLGFQLDNGCSFFVEYISNDNYVDCLRITDKYPDNTLILTKIK